MNDDTIKLLRECNAGIKMGISAINDVLENIEDNKLRDILKASREKHERMGDETHTLLTEYHGDYYVKGKDKYENDEGEGG